MHIWYLHIRYLHIYGICTCDFSFWIQHRICYCDACTWPDFLITFMLNQSRSCLFYSFWGDKFVFREWMWVLGKVKVTVVSLHQTHHSRHYSKLFHKIMYYRKCKLYLVYFHVRFAASSFSWKKQSNLFYQENHEINKICIISKHIKQFFVILFLLIFLQILPFFSFVWPRKSFLLDKRLRYPVRKSDIMTEGIKCNDGNVQTHQSHFSRPPVANQLLLIW